jgi:hypothetical protein
MPATDLESPQRKDRPSLSGVFNGIAVPVPDRRETFLFADTGRETG